MEKCQGFEMANRSQNENGWWLFTDSQDIEDYRKYSEFPEEITGVQVKYPTNEWGEIAGDEELEIWLCYYQRPYAINVWWERAR